MCLVLMSMIRIVPSCYHHITSFEGSKVFLRKHESGEKVAEYVISTVDETSTTMIEKGRMTRNSPKDNEGFVRATENTTSPNRVGTSYPLSLTDSINNSVWVES
jgi:hypothetical protein